MMRIVVGPSSFVMAASACVRTQHPIAAIPQTSATANNIPWRIFIWRLGSITELRKEMYDFGVNQDLGGVVACGLLLDGLVALPAEIEYSGDVNTDHEEHERKESRTISN